MTQSRISGIVALTADRVIGKDNDLPWPHLAPDMKRFKQLTSGHPVIMGRKTWDSIDPKYRPLSDRTNIVLSREKDLEVGGAHVFGTFEEAIVFAAQCPGGEETFVIGGGEIYAMSLPYVTRLYLTLVHLDVPGDTFFPPYKEDFTRVIDMLFEEHKGIKFTYVTLER